MFKRISLLFCSLPRSLQPTAEMRELEFTLKNLTISHPHPYLAGWLSWPLLSQAQDCNSWWGGGCLVREGQWYEGLEELKGMMSAQPFQDVSYHKAEQGDSFTAAWPCPDVWFMTNSAMRERSCGQDQITSSFCLQREGQTELKLITLRRWPRPLPFLVSVIGEATKTSVEGPKKGNKTNHC